MFDVQNSPIPRCYTCMAVMAPNGVNHGLENSRRKFSTCLVRLR